MDTATHELDEFDELDLTHGNEIAENKLAPKTKLLYAKKAATFNNYIAEKFSNMVLPSGGINYNALEPNHFTQFFGYISKKRDKNGIALDPVKYQSYEHVSGKFIA